MFLVIGGLYSLSVSLHFNFRRVNNSRVFLLRGTTECLSVSSWLHTHNTSDWTHFLLHTLSAYYKLYLDIFIYVGSKVLSESFSAWWNTLKRSVRSCRQETENNNMEALTADFLKTELIYYKKNTIKTNMLMFVLKEGRHKRTWNISVFVKVTTCLRVKS